MNFLEQLVGEWYSFQGYFVNENVKVGKLAKGGWEGDLDVVAFHPETREIVHVETSMDALSWARRRQRFGDKFRKGREHIPELFPYAGNLRQEAVFGYPRTTRDDERLGSHVKTYLMPELVKKIEEKLSETSVESGVVPEKYPLLRAMQFALDYGGHFRRG